MKLKYFSFFALIITTFLWGTTFVIVKDALMMSALRPAGLKQLQFKYD